MIPLDYEKLVSVNNEAIGWIRIEGTNVSYPVVQSTDSTKYMKTKYLWEIFKFWDAIPGLQQQSGTFGLQSNNFMVITWE